MSIEQAREEVVLSKQASGGGAQSREQRFGDVGVLVVMDADDRDVFIGELVVFSDQTVIVKKAGGTVTYYKDLRDTLDRIGDAFPMNRVAVGGVGFDVVQLAGEGSEVLKTHPSDQCLSNRACAIHNVSDHPLNTALQVWDGESGVLLRVCKHDVRHPDADLPYDVAAQTWNHLCCPDNCCGLRARRTPVEPEREVQVQVEESLEEESLNTGKVSIVCPFCGMGYDVPAGDSDEEDEALLVAAMKTHLGERHGG